MASGKIARSGCGFFFFLGGGASFCFGGSFVPCMYVLTFADKFEAMDRECIQRALTTHMTSNPWVFPKHKHMHRQIRNTMGFL